MIKKVILGLVSLFVLVSCVEPAQVDIINPDADFLYFYGATCPHCQELNDKIEEADLFSKISVEKREVYYNNENRGKFAETAKKLGLKEQDMSVPFVYDKQTGEYAVGSDKALELFNTRVSDIISSTGATQ